MKSRASLQDKEHKTRTHNQREMTPIPMSLHHSKAQKTEEGRSLKESNEEKVMPPSLPPSALLCAKEKAHCVVVLGLGGKVA
ncbi:hypothetical protein BHE74_00016282 [Ensete ventricosum]|nr:hypothetical protein BHE74_00016282 [Ensete ventricosum]